jgi:hypothetical protein
MADEYGRDVDLLILIGRLGLSVSSEFIPFSQSRNAKANAKPGERSLNWQVTVHNAAGHPILTTYYSAGVGHCPAYRQGPLERREQSPTPTRPHRVLVHKTDAAHMVEFETERGIAARSVYYTAGGDPEVTPQREIVGDKTPKTQYKKINPATLDVLYCLVSDAEAGDFASFEEWAESFGFDSDSRRAESAYRDCLATYLKLRAAIGDDGLAQLREGFADF